MLSFFDFNYAYIQTNNRLTSTTYTTGGRGAGGLRGQLLAAEALPQVGGQEGENLSCCFCVRRFHRNTNSSLIVNVITSPSRTLTLSPDMQNPYVSQLWGGPFMKMTPILHLLIASFAVFVLVCSLVVLLGVAVFTCCCLLCSCLFAGTGGPFVIGLVVVLALMCYCHCSMFMFANTFETCAERFGMISPPGVKYDSSPLLGFVATD